jgi:flavin reductase (DIM6/NTAB) family NADH-FMN oxidoreductase RutF
MAINPDEFKNTLATWPSGVSIVTSRHGDRVHGMTVSAFCSVSLDPPLVLVCADTASDTHPLIREGRRFAVSILSEGQEELARRFASDEDVHRRFEGLDCPLGVTRCPHIPGAVATLDCRVVQAVEAGDHVIYVGEVVAAGATERRPLLYHRRAYGRISGPKA